LISQYNCNGYLYVLRFSNTHINTEQWWFKDDGRQPEVELYCVFRLISILIYPHWIVFIKSHRVAGCQKHGVAIGIAFLSSLQAEIYRTVKKNV